MRTVTRLRRYGFGAFWALILAFLPLSLISFAAEDTRHLGESGRPIPRFVSLKASKANVRVGPGVEYKILWQFRRRGLPVEIIAEYQKWRQIRDYEGAEGWIHASLLRGQRSVMLRQTAEALPLALPLAQPLALRLRNAPNDNARILAFLQPGMVADLEDCDIDWCEIDAGKHDGWVPRDLLWGVYHFEYNN